MGRYLRNTSVLITLCAIWFSWCHTGRAALICYSPDDEPSTLPTDLKQFLRKQFHGFEQRLLEELFQHPELMYHKENVEKQPRDLPDSESVEVARREGLGSGIEKKSAVWRRWNGPLTSKMYSYTPHQNVAPTKEVRINKAMRYG